MLTSTVSSGIGLYLHLSVLDANGVLHRTLPKPPSLWTFPSSVKDSDADCHIFWLRVPAVLPILIVPLLKTMFHLTHIRKQNWLIGHHKWWSSLLLVEHYRYYLILNFQVCDRIIPTLIGFRLYHLPIGKSDANHVLRDKRVAPCSRCTFLSR